MKKSVGGTDTIVEVGSGSGIASSFTAYEYTASANQTTFSGSDNNSNTLAYNTGTPPAVQVFMNGILLDEGTSQDYTGTNGTSIVLTSAADAGDLIQIHAYKSDISIVSNLTFVDNQKLQFGDSNDLEIFHDGSHSRIKDIGTGNLILNTQAFRVNGANDAEGMIKANQDGSVELYYDGSKKIETTSGGIQVQGAMAATSGAYSPIYYGGSSGLQLKSNTGELFANFTNNGSSALYHDNVKKFETTTTGADVSGNMNVSGTVYFNSDLRANNVSNKLIVKASSTTTELHAAGSSGIVFKDSGNGQVASLDTGGNLVLNGLLSAEDNIYLTDAGTVRAKLLLNASDRDNVEIRAESIGSTMKFFTAATEALELAADQKATFKGSIVLNSNGKVVEIADAAIQWYSYPDSAYKQARFRATDYEFKNGGNTPVMTISSGGNLSATGDLSVGGNTTITGNLTVNGTTTTINSTELSIDDKNIIIAQGTSTSVDADGAGITINGPTNNASLIWDHSNQYMEFNKDVFTPAGFVIGTTGTKVGRMYNNSGVMALEAYSGRQISFGNVTNGEHVRIDAGGRVGIGTTSPSKELTIGGTAPMLRLQENSGSSKRLDLSITSAAVGIIGANQSASQLAFETSGSERIRISNLGKVGIGTTSPSKKLHIQDSAAHQLQLHGGNSYWNIGTGWSGYYQDYLLFATSSGEKMAIDTNGNVGIGVNGPSAKLHIIQNSTSSDALLLQSSDDTSSAAPILAFKRNSASVADADYLGQLKFKGENDADQEVVYAKITSKILDASDGSEDGLIEFANRKAGSNVITARLRSDSLQLLNDTSLALKSDGAQLQFGNDNDMQIYHNGSAGEINNATGDFTIDSAGDIILEPTSNIGVSEATPLAKMEVAGSIKATSRDTNHTAEAGLTIAYDTTNNIGLIETWTSKPLLTRTYNYQAFDISGTEMMRINSTGVGIGTNNPQTPLHVEGITRITESNNTAFYGGDYVRVFGNQYFNFRNTGGSTIARIHMNGNSYFNGGNVGIGVTSPDQKFHVEFANTDTSFSGGSNGAWGSDGIRIENTSTTANTMAMLHLRNGDADVHIAGIRQGTDDSDLGFFFEGSEKVRFTHDGNVGIGTNAPDTNLEVDIKNGADGNGIHITSTSTTNDPTLKLSRNGGSADRFQFMVRGGAGSARLGISAGNNLDSGLNLGSNNGLSIGTVTAAGSGGLLVDNDIKSNSRFGVGSGGSLSDAAIYKNSDTNTGIYWPGTDQIALTTAGSNRLHISSNGGVSLNSQNQLTTGGNARLSIIDSSVQLSMGASNSDMSYIRKQGAGQFAWQTYNSGNSGILQLQPYGGNVTINTTAAVSGHALSVSGKIGGLTYTDSYLQFTGGNAILKANDDVAIGYTSSLYVKQSGKVGIGNSNPQASLQVEVLGIETNQSSVTSTNQFQCEAMSATAFRSARYTVQVTNVTDSTYQITEILLIHDGTTPSITEYGTIYTGSAAEASFDAEIANGNVRLLATPASSDNMQFKVVRHSILV